MNIPSSSKDDEKIDSVESDQDEIELMEDDLLSDGHEELEGIQLPSNSSSNLEFFEYKRDGVIEVNGYTARRMQMEGAKFNILNEQEYAEYRKNPEEWNENKKKEEMEKIEKKREEMKKLVEGKTETETTEDSEESKKSDEREIARKEKKEKKIEEKKKMVEMKKRIQMDDKIMHAQMRLFMLNAKLKKMNKAKRKDRNNKLGWELDTIEKFMKEDATVQHMRRERRRMAKMDKEEKERDKAEKWMRLEGKLGKLYEQRMKEGKTPLGTELDHQIKFFERVMSDYEITKLKRRRDKRKKERKIEKNSRGKDMMKKKEVKSFMKKRQDKKKLEKQKIKREKKDREIAKMSIKIRTRLEVLNQKRKEERKKKNKGKMAKIKKIDQEINNLKDKLKSEEFVEFRKRLEERKNKKKIQQERMKMKARKLEIFKKLDELYDGKKAKPNQTMDNEIVWEIEYLEKKLTSKQLAEFRKKQNHRKIELQDQIEKEMEEKISTATMRLWILHEMRKQTDANNELDWEIEALEKELNEDAIVEFRKKQESRNANETFLDMEEKKMKVSMRLKELYADMEKLDEDSHQDLVYEIKYLEKDLSEEEIAEIREDLEEERRSDRMQVTSKNVSLRLAELYKKQEDLGDHLDEKIEWEIEELEKELNEVFIFSFRFFFVTKSSIIFQ